MRLKVICTRPSQQTPESVAGDEASPRLVADAAGEALPPMRGSGP